MSRLVAFAIALSSAGSLLAQTQVEVFSTKKFDQSRSNDQIRSITDKLTSRTFTGPLKGLVPASTGAASTDVLNADGTWKPAPTPSVTRTMLSSSVMCDGGAFGQYDGTRTGDQTLLDYTYPADARYLIVTCSGWVNSSLVSVRAVIDVAGSTIVGGYASLSYNATNRYGAAISGAISVPHTLYIGQVNVVHVKITAWDTGARHLVITAVGSSSGISVFAAVEAFR